MLSRWRFRAWPQAEYAELVDFLHATPPERERALSPKQASWLMRNVARGRGDVSLLRALVDSTTGYDVSGEGMWTKGLWDLVDAALEGGRLLLVPVPYTVPVVHAPQANQKREDPPLAFGDEQKPLDWIEFEFVDGAGEPLAGTRYELKLVDGSLRQGVTDGAGRIRLERVEAGTCSITFPDVDGAEWEPA
jgi:hypothetical protein